MFLGLLDSDPNPLALGPLLDLDPDPLVRGMGRDPDPALDSDPSITKKNSKENLDTVNGGISEHLKLFKAILKLSRISPLKLKYKNEKILTGTDTTAVSKKNFFVRN
jgi:hypothetical protein